MAIVGAHPATEAARMRMLRNIRRRFEKGVSLMKVAPGWSWLAEERRNVGHSWGRGWHVACDGRARCVLGFWPSVSSSGDVDRHALNRRARRGHDDDLSAPADSARTCARGSRPRITTRTPTMDRLRAHAQIDEGQTECTAADATGAADVRVSDHTGGALADVATGVSEDRSARPT